MLSASHTKFKHAASSGFDHVLDVGANLDAYNIAVRSGRDRFGRFSQPPLYQVVHPSP
jgi:hypothetical protein